MEDSGKIEALKAIAEVKNRERSRLRPIASVRASPGGYLAAASVLTFVSALLLRDGNDALALAILAAAWLVVPVLAMTDRIVFDGRSLARRGAVPLFWRAVSGRNQQLSLVDFERVDTNAVRTLRRGGNVRYRYRTQIFGKGISFVIASGGKSYRALVHHLFPVIDDQKIDARTCELRDHLRDPKSVKRNARHLHLASPLVLDDAASTLKSRLSSKRATPEMQSSDDLERSQQLRELGNQLRVAGRLREAREAFRRALIVQPQNAGMIYEFARLLRSEASAFSDSRLLRRARAALHLSSLRAGADATLLSSIGESLVECGDIKRAERVLHRSLSLDSRNFRARSELADLALRNGKLAHVIHDYRDAAQIAPDKAAALYASREADYYARLNDDDSYLTRELRRINWLQGAARVRRLGARITNASILFALVGGYVDPTLGSIGWSLASSALVAWLLALSLGKLLTDRGQPRPAA